MITPAGTAGVMNHCCKAGLHPKTAVLNSSTVLSKAPKLKTHAKAEERLGAARI